MRPKSVLPFSGFSKSSFRKDYTDRWKEKLRYIFFQKDRDFMGF